MKKSLFILLALFLGSCGSKVPDNVHSANFLLSIQLPASMYIHQAEFIFPDTLKIGERNFLVGHDSSLKSISFHLSAKEVNQLLTVGSDFLIADTQPHYGFEEEGERTELLYELDVELNGVKKNVLVYNPRKGLKLPSPVNNYMKLLSGFMSRYNNLE